MLLSDSLMKIQWSIKITRSFIFSAWIAASNTECLWSHNLCRKLARPGQFLIIFYTIIKPFCQQSAGQSGVVWGAKLKILCKFVQINYAPPAPYRTDRAYSITMQSNQIEQHFTTDKDIVLIINWLSKFRSGLATRNHQKSSLNQNM